jgi:hypothetical protein
MSEKVISKELSEAKALLEQDKKDRAEKGRLGFENMCKELNLKPEPVFFIDDQKKIPVSSVVTFPCGIMFIPLD